jgi:hypothetical protein
LIFRLTSSTGDAAADDGRLGQQPLASGDRQTTGRQLDQR